jgi:hypothetical protein
MLYQDIKETLHRARHDFETATVDNIIELGRQYLALLEKYLRELRGNPNAPGRHLLPASSSSYEAIDGMRKVIQGEIEQAEQERDRVGAALDYFDEVSGNDIVEVFNRLKYKGRDSWKLRGFNVLDGSGDTMSIVEAARAAGRLRREEYVARRASSEK